jgi:hypothetical protein
MTVPFALSIHNFVNSVGAYVGLASIIAVAILILLYFAHSRETATLRDRLDEAQQRISGLEARIGQMLQMQQRGRPAGAVAPAPVAPPVPVRSPGAPQGSVRRVPNPVTAAAAASAAPAAGLAQAAVQPRPLGAVPAAPAGMAGPALASATKMIPDDASVGAPDDTMFVPAAAAAAAAAAGAANGKTEDRTAVLAAAKATPAAAASAAVASASPRGAVAAPPRVQISAEQEAAPAATVAGAAGAAGGTKVRRIGGHPESPSVSLPAFDDESVGGRRFSGAVLPLLVAAVAVAVIVAGLIVITNSGGSTNANITHNNTNAGATGQNLHKKHTAAAPFSAAKVTVAVLNGTAQQGLAGDVDKKLANDGYKRGNVTNAASQTQNLTFVYFMTGKANKIAAQHVAKALALPPSRVHHAGSGVVQSCTISATGASLGSCSANVIVSVGQDRVTLASSG